MDKFGFVYKTTNQVNGMKYIGKCIYQRQNNWETYLGSGVYLKRAIKKYGKKKFTREILAEATSADELNKLEIYYISVFNAVASTEYYNLSETAIGGDMFTNHPRKEELRQMRSQQMSGKGNHQYGKPKTERLIKAVKKANSKKVRIDGKEFNSLGEASKILGTNVSTLSYRLDSRNYPTYERLEPKRQLGFRDMSRQNRRISINGIEYPSMKDASKKLDMPASTVSSRVRSDKYPNYKRL